MAEQPLEQLTLRETLVISEQLARELMLHLEQGFAPKVKALQELIASAEPSEGVSSVPDVTVRNQVATVLQSDDFSQALFKKVARYLESIDQGVNRALSEQA